MTAPVEHFPRMTVWPGNYVAHEEYPGGTWTVHEVTRDDGVVRMTEPLLMLPDREQAEAYVASLLAPDTALRRAA